MEKFIVDDNYSYLEFQIERKSFYDDELVLEYINSIAGYSKLDEEVEQKLINLKSKDKASRDKLIESYLYLPVLLASKYATSTSSLSNMDLIEYGNMGLIEGISSYPIENGDLEKYLIKRIRKSILIACQKEGKVVNIPGNFQDTIIKLNKMEENFYMSNGYKLDEEGLYDEWSSREGIDYFDIRNWRLRKPKKDKYKVCSNLRHSIESLDTKDLEQVMGIDESVDLEKELYNSMIREIINDAFANQEFTDLEIKILKSIHGLTKEKTTSELAQELNISVKEVSHCYKSALNRLKTYAGYKLAPFREDYVKSL